MAVLALGCPRRAWYRVRSLPCSAADGRCDCRSPRGSADLQRCGLGPLSSARLSAERRAARPSFSRDELLRAVSKIAPRVLRPRAVFAIEYSTVNVVIFSHYHLTFDLSTCVHSLDIDIFCPPSWSRSSPAGLCASCNTNDTSLQGYAYRMAHHVARHIYILLLARRPQPQRGSVLRSQCVDSELQRDRYRISSPSRLPQCGDATSMAIGVD